MKYVVLLVALAFPCEAFGDVGVVSIADYKPRRPFGGEYPVPRVDPVPMVSVESFLPPKIAAALNPAATSDCPTGTCANKQQSNKKTTTVRRRWRLFN